MLQNIRSYKQTIYTTHNTHVHTITNEL